MGASLLPNAKQQFEDINGNPLVGGSVTHYEVGTLVPKDTWQDEAQGILNSNPIILDSRGQAIIYGNGNYRQILKDSLGNLIWDEVIAAPLTPGNRDQHLYPQIFIEGQPTNAELYDIKNMPVAGYLPVSLVGSYFTIDNLPTASFVITLNKKSGITTTLIGTITFDTSGVPTVNVPNQINFLAGDQIRTTWPSPQDLTGANIALTLDYIVS